MGNKDTITMVTEIPRDSELGTLLENYRNAAAALELYFSDRAYVSFKLAKQGETASGN